MTHTERRKRQRFAARRDENPCISICIDGQHLPVIDLSIDGFSVQAGVIAPESEFDFQMRLIDGFGDKVSARALAVNCILTPLGAQTGCRFLNLTEENLQTIKEWLTVIIICSASIRLSPQEAEAIVTGPSLI